MTQTQKMSRKASLRPLFLRKSPVFGRKFAKIPGAVTIHGENFAQKKFTGKELDTETGLYYFGARYLDPKTGRWISGDPAISDYIPSAPVSEEAKKRNGSLPGMGGVFNVVNMHVYHYAGNNPVKYTDPDGNQKDYSTIFRLSADENGSGGGGSTNHYASKGFNNPRGAAKAALQVINLQSIRENREYGGLIYQNKKDGKYYASIAIPGNAAEARPFDSPIPDDARIVGDYHTHGDYSVRGTDGKPVRTENPNDDFYNSENFSDVIDITNSKRVGDIANITINARNLNEPSYRGYLGTPSGNFKEYNPYTGQTIIINQSGE